MTDNAGQNKHACGPAADKELPFEDFRKLLAKHPHLGAHKYRIACTDHETEIMKIDFQKQGSLKRIEGGAVVTEFKPLLEIERFAERNANGFALSIDLVAQLVGGSGNRQYPERQ